ncbi:MAG: outer membrane beta-barrel protein [Brucellaceae bacterium]|nr:outer membrane beta-barrel protein [Brucellaceae bacterium]
MSGPRPVPRGGAARPPYKALRYAIVAAGSFACIPLLAQELPPLRGSVSETLVAEEILPQDDANRVDQAETDRFATRADPSGDRGLQPTRYQPVSAGALPDEPDADARPEDETLFPSADDQDDADFLAPPPRPAARPRSAQTRLEAERDALTDGPESAEERTARTARALRGPSEDTLDDETTGTVRVGTIDSEDEERNRAADPSSERAEPIEGLADTSDDDPYAPLGLRVGTFTVRPTLEQGVTWTSNTYSSANPESSTLSETTLRLNATSDWARHYAALNGYGTFRKSIAGAPYSNFEAGIDGELRLDLGNEFQATATAGYQRRPEDASSPVEIVGVTGEPIRQTLSGSLGLAKNLGKLRFAVTGQVERDIYGDADLDTGGTLSQKDRNTTLATVALRAGYEVSPAITPFAELEIGRRFYDVEMDAAGYERSANRLGASAGVEFDLRDKLTGEIAAGWFREDIDDPRLASISGLLLRGNLDWSPVRGTTVTLDGSTTVEGTTTAGESGSLLYAGSIALARDIRQNLTTTATLGASYRDYVGTGGHDLTLSGQVGLTWWLNRNVGFTGRARYERVTSNLPGRTTNTTSVYAGVTLRR